MRRILLAVVVVAMGVACHTITEELPARFVWTARR